MTKELSFFAEIFGGGASSIAPRVDRLFWALVVVSSAIVALLVLLNLVFMIRYRRGSPANRAPLNISEWKIEVTWIAGTTFGFLGFFFWGADVYLEMEHAPSDAYDIQVVGRQWMWDIRQPNGRREFDELHVPLGRNVRLLLTSEDVIHSLFVPAFRIKQDVVPGKMVSLWFKPTQEGTYPLYCTQYCGTEHSQMTGRVVVLSPSAYADWLESGTRTTVSTSRGRQLYLRYGCNGCHDQPSQIHAPPLTALFGSMVPLADGSFVRADESYLHDSIYLPGKQVVAGYTPIMPSYQGVMPEADVLELINYLTTLSPPSAAPLSPPPP